MVIVRRRLHVEAFLRQRTLTDEERQRITRSPTVVQEREYHLILSKKADGSQALVERFNQGLKAIRADGTYKSILDALNNGAYDE